MSETETPRRRRRSLPVPNLSTDTETASLTEQTDSQVERQEPMRIAAEADIPSWMVSKDDISGAADRRNGIRKLKKIESVAETPDNKKTGEDSHITEKRKVSSPRAGRKMVLAEHQKKPKQKRRKKRTPLRAIWVTFSIVLLGGLLYLGARGGMQLLDIKRTLDQGENTFYGNLYMNNIPLEGLTMEQASQIVRQQVDSKIASFRITLRTQDGRSWEITAKDLGMEYHTADQLDQLWSVGHTGTSRERYDQVKALADNPIWMNAPLTYDLSDVNRILSGIKAEIDVPAISATKVPDDTKWPPFSYTDDIPGQTLDISGLNQRIAEMCESITGGEVELIPTKVEANVTREWLEGQIVRLASYETAVGATSHEGRFTNIRIGTEKFNHLIVKAGETVSFNKVTGKRTEANGFVEAPEIAYGEYVMGTGGGICQVSSTLYNAVVNAGLQVTKRTQHSLPSNYVPKGQDATVSDNRLDFVFRNNTSAPLYFETQYYKKKNYWYSEFVIYGRPDPNGYTYRLESEVREVIPLPDPIYKADRSMTYVVYNDETYQISKGEEGFIVDVYLVTTNANGLQISRNLQYTDTYKAVAPQYYIGIMTREGS